MSPNLPPLALYIHLPWCVRKCPYCDFNSHRAPAELPEAAYVTKLLEDLEHDLRWVAGRSLVSIFIGGGTPSLFSPAAIARLLHGVRARVDCAPGLEITLEANPGTIEHGDFAEYRTAGVNRVSLGVQSFNDAHLRKLGRIHGRDDVERSIHELQSAGIYNFNLDLMYALPGQSVDDALVDVRAAIRSAPTHLSLYQLTLEPGTPFYRQPPPCLPDTDLAWEIQSLCQSELAAAGYEQYEVSAYSRPDQQCIHNRNYWEFGDYIGIGAGAHGKLTDSHMGVVYRSERKKQPRQYLESAGAIDRVSMQEVPSKDLSFEFMLNTLRLNTETTGALFEARTGLPMTGISQPLARATELGLLQAGGGDRWRVTTLGQKFLNDLQMLFLPAG